MNHETFNNTLLASALALVLVAPALAHPHAAAQTANHHYRAHGLVRTVIENVSQYSHIDAALADGFVQATGCVSGGMGGGMGVHYARLDRIGDGALDPARPELLVYEPTAWGAMRLVAVDFLVLKSTWEANNGPGVPPVLDGQHLMFVGEPNRFALPAFYMLHVWAFRHNGNGMFAMFNPDVSCEFYDPQ